MKPSINHKFKGMSVDGALPISKLTIPNQIYVMDESDIVK